MSSERQGLMRLNTGDTFTRVNGVQTLTTPQGDTLSIAGKQDADRLSGLAMMAPGARVEMLNEETGKFERVARLPSGFG